jgi:hypothetical protein
MQVHSYAVGNGTNHHRLLQGHVQKEQTRSRRVSDYFQPFISIAFGREEGGQSPGLGPFLGTTDLSSEKWMQLPTKVILNKASDPSKPKHGSQLGEPMD